MERRDEAAPTLNGPAPPPAWSQNIHMLFLLFIVPAEWRRTIVIVMLVMMVMGRMGPF